jgi:hypothetical protein
MVLAYGDKQRHKQLRSGAMHQAGRQLIVPPVSAGHAFVQRSRHTHNAPRCGYQELAILEYVTCSSMSAVQAARGSVAREAAALEEQRAALASLLAQLEQREEALGQVRH